MNKLIIELSDSQVTNHRLDYHLEQIANSVNAGYTSNKPPFSELKWELIKNV